MSYTPTIWIDGETPVNAENLNKLENAVYQNTEEITQINTAIENGELKGEKGDTGETGAAGSDGVSCTHSWDGTTLTVSSASGTSSADLKGEKGDTGAVGPRGEKGDTGPQGPQGDPGADGTSVFVTTVSETLQPGGSNVVSFSDGKTLTVKNGQKGVNWCGRYSDEISYALNDAVAYNGASYIAIADYAPSGTAPDDTTVWELLAAQGNMGPTGASGAAGYTPERGTDYWTAADQTAIVNDVLANLSKETWIFTLEDGSSVEKAVPIL